MIQNMHGAKQNSIKTKIDNLNQLPEGFSYNHASSWQKLENKLQKGKQKNYRWWIYAAAVVLIISGISIWKMNFNSTNHNIIEKKTVKAKSTIETLEPV